MKRRIEAHDRIQAALSDSMPGYIRLRDAAFLVHRAPQTLSERIRNGTLAAKKVRDAQTAEYWIEMKELDRVYPRSKRVKVTRIPQGPALDAAVDDHIPDHDETNAILTKEQT